MDINKALQQAEELLRGQGLSQLPQDLGKYYGDKTTFVKRTKNMPLTNKLKGGSVRDVYDLGNGMVVKIAKHPRGLEQNDSESDWFLQATGFRPRAIEEGKDYVIMEKAERDDKKAREFLKPLRKFTGHDFENKTGELQDAMNDMGLGDFMNYDLLWNDFIAPRNWGFVKGHPVLTDGGAVNKNVHANSKVDEFAQNDWNDVLRERKQVKQQFSNTQQVIKNAQNILHSKQDAQTTFDTLIKNGGVTINTKGEQPTEGYVYSPYKKYETVIPEDEFSSEDIEEFKEKHKDILKKPGHHFGAWFDNGKWYLDISKVGPPTFETYKEAFDNGQEGIYNIKGGVTYYTPHSKNYGTKIDGTNPYRGIIEQGNGGENTQNNEGEVPTSLQEKSPQEVGQSSVPQNSYDSDIIERAKKLRGGI